jgi:histidyl-tRNA synthetase
VRNSFERVANAYNFKIMEPASVEHLSTLRAKSGDEVDKEIYAFKDKAERDIGLRFDLTVGITRYICSRRGMKLPAKIAAFGGIWRYEEPQHGRFRWSHQWDLEIFGPSSVDSDAEVIDASAAVLKGVGLDHAVVKVGDRRAVEAFIRDQVGIADQGRRVELMRALDKVEKKTRREILDEYTSKGFEAGDVDRVLDLGKLSGSPDEVLEAAVGLRLGSMDDLALLRDILRSRGVANVEYSMSVVRGIDYYTGIVFEASDPSKPGLGSLFGGGRYDALPRVFGRPDLSATGAAGGVEREAMSMAPPPSGSGGLAVVALASEAAHPYASRVLSLLRRGGIRSDLAPGGRTLAKQLEDASRAGASWVLIVGEKEMASESVTLREMKGRTESSVRLGDVLRRLSA